MTKAFHELRDPIHTFIRYDSHEREVIDSKPFQRLRHIHQLSMTYLLYPGATHKRFEHSLGVMELSSRIYDVIIHLLNISDNMREVIPVREDERQYWRKALRMAALCHDLGHLPFSHAAEKELLPDYSHELLTVDLIKSEIMQPIWKAMRPPLDPDDIAKLAVGPKVLKEVKFSDWEALLAEVIVGDSFGADRMDYLLRDSHHAGVMYGKFDHNRLIDTLRILPKTYEQDSMEPALGLEEGGIHAAEALMLARYFMFIQVYLHPVRRIYDRHLKDFLLEWLPEGRIDRNIDFLLSMTDNEVSSAFAEAARKVESKGHDAADRIVNRKHFKVLYRRNPTDLSFCPKPGEAIAIAVRKKFSDSAVKHDEYLKGGGGSNFPVQLDDGAICSSHSDSKTLKEIPDAVIDFVFIDPEMRESARKWLKENKISILKEAQSAKEED